MFSRNIPRHFFRAVIIATFKFYPDRQIYQKESGKILRDMNKNQIRKEIAELIDSIKERSDEIGTRKRIPQIELELMLSKIKRLYERSIIFNYLNTIEEMSQKDKVEDAQTYTNEKPDHQRQLETVTERAPVNTPEPEVVVPHVSEPVEKPTVREQAITPPPVVQASIPSKGKDIKTLIGLNEKFLFTKELFNNDPQLYTSALDRLNQATDKASVDEVLIQLGTERGWGDENKTAESFRKLAARRF
jgi:hypothetical protein